jgi:hypothetical protein
MTLKTYCVQCRSQTGVTGQLCAKCRAKLIKQAHAKRNSNIQIKYCYCLFCGHKSTEIKCLSCKSMHPA